jgi:hypothetical protein
MKERRVSNKRVEKKQQGGRGRRRRVKILPCIECPTMSASSVDAQRSKRCPRSLLRPVCGNVIDVWIRGQFTVIVDAIRRSGWRTFQCNVVTARGTGATSIGSAWMHKESEKQGEQEEEGEAMSLAHCLFVLLLLFCFLRLRRKNRFLFPFVSFFFFFGRQLSSPLGPLSEKTQSRGSPPLSLLFCTPLDNAYQTPQSNRKDSKSTRGNFVIHLVFFGFFCFLLFTCVKFAGDKFPKLQSDLTKRLIHRLQTERNRKKQNTSMKMKKKKNFKKKSLQKLVLIVTGSVPIKSTFVGCHALYSERIKRKSMRFRPFPLVLRLAASVFFMLS